MNPILQIHSKHRKARQRRCSFGSNAGNLNESIFNDNYGVKRMQLALKQYGLSAGIRKITRIMREKGWLHKRKRRPNGLIKVTMEIQEKKNLIKKGLTSDVPFCKLLIDISQIQCSNGKLYISPVMDCYNGEILALNMGNNIRRKLCINTLIAARKRYPL